MTTIAERPVPNGQASQTRDSQTNDLVYRALPTVPLPEVEPEVLEMVLATGNVKGLSAAQRVQYYHAICQSLGLNPLTRPFEYVELKGKLSLYAKKDATDQLRKKQSVNIEGIQIERDADSITVTASASLPNGRQDMDIGVVCITNLRGEDLANARMKAMTKAKRRVTLSICGLGWADDSEIDSIPGARRVRVNDAGEILLATEETQRAGLSPEDQAAADEAQEINGLAEAINEILRHAKATSADLYAALWQVRRETFGTRKYAEMTLTEMHTLHEALLKALPEAESLEDDDPFAEGYVEPAPKAAGRRKAA